MRNHHSSTILITLWVLLALALSACGAGGGAAAAADSGDGAGSGPGSEGDAEVCSGDPDVVRASKSVVRIRGIACGLGVEGSGWIVRRELVVTNAHVVGSAKTVELVLDDGAEMDGESFGDSEVEAVAGEPARAARRRGRSGGLCPSGHESDSFPPCVRTRRDCLRHRVDLGCAHCPSRRRALSCRII